MKNKEIVLNSLYDKYNTYKEIEDLNKENILNLEKFVINEYTGEVYLADKLAFGTTLFSIILIGLIFCIISSFIFNLSIITVFIPTIIFIFMTAAILRKYNFEKKVFSYQINKIAPELNLYFNEINPQLRKIKNEINLNKLQCKYLKGS